MSAADRRAEPARGAPLAAIIAAAVDAFLREESSARAESARTTRGGISAWRMAARTEPAAARGYGANVGWRGID